MLPAVDAMLSICPFSYLYCASLGFCVSVVVVVELAVALWFYFILNVHSCFCLHSLVTSDSLSQSFDELTYRIVVHPREENQDSHGQRDIIEV